MPPRVTIHINSNLGDAYEDAQARINARHHGYETQFPRYANTDAEYAEQRDLATQAGHVDTSGNVDWERIVK